MNLSETKFRALVRALLKENESYKEYNIHALGMKVRDAVKDNNTMGTKSVFNLEDNAIRTRLVHKKDPSIKLVPKSNDKSTQTFKEYIRGGKPSTLDFVKSIDMTKLGKATNVQRPKEKIITILMHIDSASISEDIAKSETNVQDVESKQSATKLQQQQKQQQQNTDKEPAFKKEPGPNIDVSGLTVKQAINAYLGVKNPNGTYPSKWNEQTEAAWDNFIETDFVNYFKFLDQGVLSKDEGYEGSDYQKQIKSLIDTGYKDFQREFNGAIDKYKKTSGFEDKGPKGALTVLATIHHYPESMPDNTYNLVYNYSDSGSSNINITANMSLVEKADQYANIIDLPARIIYGILSVESGGNSKATAFNSDNFVECLSEEPGNASDKKGSYDNYKSFVESQPNNKGVGGVINDQGKFTRTSDVAYYSSHSDPLSKKIQDKALEINFTAAFRATAWGAFQIMGFNAVEAGDEKKARELYQNYVDTPQKFSNDMLLIYFNETPKIINQYIKANDSDDINDYLAAAKTYYGKADMKYAQGVKSNAEAYDKIKAAANQ